MKYNISDLKIKLVLNDGECLEYKLRNKDGEDVTSYSIEWDKPKIIALISYETGERYRNHGYASIGLNMLKNELFINYGALILELIDLSGDYSRKVAENAGFFSPCNSLDYFVAINPAAEKVLLGKLQQFSSDSKLNMQLQRLLARIRSLKKIQISSRIKMQEKLDGLRQTLELADDEEYKKQLLIEIAHLEGVVNQDVSENIKQRGQK